MLCENPNFNLGKLTTSEESLIKDGSLSDRQRDEAILIAARNTCLILKKLDEQGIFVKILYKFAEKIGIREIFNQDRR